ncbi:MAG: hypothetical protein AB9915_01355 [Candidatus Dojkabacteria bacterium]
MPNRKETIKRISLQVLEPFALGLLALLFIIPSITVLNLSPITKQLEKLNILGVTTENDISITLVEGKHNIFTSELLNKLDSKYEYFVNISKRESDSYSKPILKIENKNSEEKTLEFYGQTSSNTRSNIYIRIGEKSYKLQDDKGFTYTEEVKLAPSENIVVFLVVENLSSVQFSEDFSMSISQKN